MDITQRTGWLDCVGCGHRLSDGQPICPSCGFEHDRCQQCGGLFYEEFTATCPDCITDTEEN